MGCACDAMHRPTHDGTVSVAARALTARNNGCGVCCVGLSRFVRYVCVPQYPIQPVSAMIHPGVHQQLLAALLAGAAQQLYISTRIHAQAQQSTASMTTQSASKSAQETLSECRPAPLCDRPAAPTAAATAALADASAACLRALARARAAACFAALALRSAASGAASGVAGASAGAAVSAAPDALRRRDSRALDTRYSVKGHTPGGGALNAPVHSEQRRLHAAQDLLHVRLPVRAAATRASALPRSGGCLRAF